MVDNVKIGDHDDDGHRRGVRRVIQEVHLSPDKQQGHANGKNGKPKNRIVMIIG